ncbi:hypothetical protein [Streptomyces sp. WAC04114]|uniref:hypothetical protein n=1 Tax=Streptomyces sp. WAC04114 TaxID=2867961 RepID=UPI001C8CBDC1|nr:hypothetical protein [Streptomyces sp. WAC04114]MBX9360267.1 hypothetical protein [Streptomyces sp. WAC04114]
MDIASPQTRRPAHASPRPGRGSAAEMDTPMAVFVGERFAAALHEGLSRAGRPRQTGPARPGDAEPLARPPGHTVARQDALLAEHAAEILARFGVGLRAVPGVTAADRARMTAWARRVLEGTGHAGPVRAGGTAPWAAMAGSLLVESAADVLPDGSVDGTRALGALARAIRLSGTGGTRSGDLGLPDRRKQGLQ